MVCCLHGFGCRELSVVVRMSCYFNFSDVEPKAYSRRKTLSPIVVDASSYVLLQLINHIAEHFIWVRSNISLYFVHPLFVMKYVFQLKVLEWFNLNLKNGVVHIDAQINDFDGPLHFLSTKHRLHPTIRERVQEKFLEITSTQSLDLVSFVNPTQVTQETYHKESDTPTKEGATTIKEGATSTKKARKLNENHMMRRRSGLMRRECTLTLILLLH
jgi:hypothetical protein